MHIDAPATPMHRGLDRLEQPLAIGSLRLQPVLNDIDPLSRRRGLLRVHARVALRLQVGPDLLRREVGWHDDRKRDCQPRIAQLRAASLQLVDHLLRRVPADGLAAAATVQHRGAREQQLQVIVELGHRADRAARGAHRVGLIDRDGGRHAVDPIDCRAVHPIQELARVRRECLDVTALPLGV